MVPAYESTANWWRPEPAEVGAELAPPVSGRPTSTPTDDAAGRVAFAALVAFTGILVLSPQMWFPILKNFRIAFLAGGIAIAAHVLESAVRRDRTNELQPAFVIAFLLVGWAVLTVPFSYWPGGSVNVLTDHYLKAIAFFWLIGVLVTTRARLRVFGWTLVLCALPLALTALDNYRSGVFLYTQNGTVKRIAGYVGGSGLAGNPNDLALMLNLILPIAGVFVLSARRIWQRLLAGAIMLVSTAAVIITFSRAGFLTLAIIAVAALVVFAKRRRPGIAVAIIVLAFSVPPLLPAGYLNRLETITDISADTTGSAQGRWNDLGASIDIVSRSPIIGVGIGQDILALNEQRGETWRSVHNVYLQYAIDLGLPGLFLFLSLLWVSLQTTWRVQRATGGQPGMKDLTLMADAVQISLIGFAVAAFFHPIAYQFYFFWVAGLAMAVRNITS